MCGTFRSEPAGSRKRRTSASIQPRPLRSPSSLPRANNCIPRHTPKIGRPEAQKIVDEASRKAVAEKRNLHDVLREDARVTAQLTPGELARLFELMGYQGTAQTLIDRQIGSLQVRAAKRP